MTLVARGGKLLVLFFVSFQLPSAAYAAASCGDHLARLAMKPPELIFVACEQDKQAQGRPFIATYRVNGAQAGVVEHYFMRKIHMKKIRRICCIWESGSNPFRGGDGLDYVLSMSAGETLVSRRAGWKEIPSFQVEVLTYAEEP